MYTDDMEVESTERSETEGREEGAEGGRDSARGRGGTRSG